LRGRRIRVAPIASAFLSQFPGTHRLSLRSSMNCAIKDQNLEVLPGGFDVRDEQIAEQAAALVKAGTDAIVAGPERLLHAVQALTHTVPLIGMSEDLLAEGS